jgi:hypothetical protein
MGQSGMTFNHYGLHNRNLRMALAILCLSWGMIGAGCAQHREPLQVDVTQLAPYVNAAKPPNCDMPVLTTMPLTNYQQVAIVEAWADLKDNEADVLPALKRKACETGADALVIVNSEHQDIQHLLYGANPNEERESTEKKNYNADSGEYIHEMEHTRRIGEAGHNGFYIDGAAINYRRPADKRSSSEGAPPLSSPPNG